jgi:hypothetical protein
MSTETQYKSVLKPIKISKYKGLEVRGLWEVKNNLWEALLLIFLL